MYGEISIWYESLSRAQWILNTPSRIFENIPQNGPEYSHRNLSRHGLERDLHVNSEFTQQDGRKKRTAKRLSVTNVTGLLLACFVANSLKINVSYSSTKRSVQRNVKFGGSKAKAELLSRLSHKVCRRLSSPVLLRKFTNP